MFKASIGAFSAELLRLMDAAESNTAPAPMPGMSAQDQQESLQFAHILAQAFTGSSPQLVMHAEAQNGMESWTVIVQRGGHTAGTAQVQQLTAPLQTRFSGSLTPPRPSCSASKGSC